MYIYKNDDSASSEILTIENWESDKTNDLNGISLLFSITWFRTTIYVLDIGANIGWYSLFIAEFGYNILYFELGNYIKMRENAIIILVKEIEGMDGYFAIKKKIYHKI